jgi:hypothetical protein
MNFKLLNYSISNINKEALFVVRQKMTVEVNKNTVKGLGFHSSDYEGCLLGCDAVWLL